MVENPRGKFATELDANPAIKKILFFDFVCPSSFLAEKGVIGRNFSKLHVDFQWRFEWGQQQLVCSLVSEVKTRSEIVFNNENDKTWRVTTVYCEEKKQGRRNIAHCIDSRGDVHSWEKEWNVVVCRQSFRCVQPKVCLFWTSSNSAHNSNSRLGIIFALDSFHLGTFYGLNRHIPCGPECGIQNIHYLAFVQLKNKSRSDALGSTART